MGISKGSAEWQGTFKEGKGIMKPEHAEAAQFSVSSRFEGKQGSNPEELIGAALAGCFSMALSVGIEKAGGKPQLIQSKADVHLDKQATGFAITSIDLSAEATVAGLDAERFQAIAAETKVNCPVSKVLAATTINLTATLKAL